MFALAKEYFDVYKKEVILGVIIFLAASLAFGAGNLAARKFNHASIIIEKCSHQ